MQKIVLAISGSSGSIYAKNLIDLFSTIDNLEVNIVMSDNAKINWELELGKFNENEIPFKIYTNKDFFAPFASGSALYDAMVICPCSMGMIGRIASGISNDLISRASDVFLKERRRLIIVPRESPYNLIHLRNMTTIAEAGGIICPATPSFYSKPQSVQDVIKTVTYRVLDLLGIPQNSYRWGQ